MYFNNYITFIKYGIESKPPLGKFDASISGIKNPFRKP
jgi:hypothetical protein